MVKFVEKILFVLSILVVFAISEAGCPDKFEKKLESCSGAGDVNVKFSTEPYVTPPVSVSGSLEDGRNYSVFIISTTKTFERMYTHFMKRDITTKNLSLLDPQIVMNLRPLQSVFLGEPQPEEKLFFITLFFRQGISKTNTTIKPPLFRANFDVKHYEFSRNLTLVGASYKTFPKPNKNLSALYNVDLTIMDVDMQVIIYTLLAVILIMVAFHICFLFVGHAFYKRRLDTVRIHNDRFYFR